MRFQIDWTPEALPTHEDDAIAATWCKLCIRLDDDTTARIVTTVLDKHSRTVRDHVFDSVLPLALWFAECWYSLFECEPRSTQPDDDRRSAYRWRRSHALRLAEGGCAYPNLLMWRIRSDAVALRWEPDDTDDPWERVRFIGSGEVVVPLVTARQVIERFVDGVLARLRALAPTSWRTAELDAAWLTTRERTSRAAQRAALAARLGQFVWELDADLVASLDQLADQGLEPLVGPLLEAGAIGDFGRAAAIARGLLQAGNSAPAASSDWTALRATLRRNDTYAAYGSRPWQVGWTRAARLRSVFAASDEEPLDPQPVLEKIGAINRRIADVPPGSGLAAWVDGHGPIRADAGKAARFALARDLYPMLFVGSTSRSNASLLSPGSFGVGPEARAFAAELLAPVERIRLLLGKATVIDDARLRGIARELDAPLGCVRHQIEDHRLAEVAWG